MISEPSHTPFLNEPKQKNLRPEEKAKYLENIREVDDQDPQRCEICQMIKKIYRALLTQISTIIK